MRLILFFVFPTTLPGVKEDDVLDLEDDVSYTEDSMLAHGGFKCISCKNNTWLYKFVKIWSIFLKNQKIWPYFRKILGNIQILQKSGAQNPEFVLLRICKPWNLL